MNDVRSVLRGWPRKMVYLAIIIVLIVWAAYSEHPKMTTDQKTIVLGLMLFFTAVIYVIFDFFRIRKVEQLFTRELRIEDMPIGKYELLSSVTNADNSYTVTLKAYDRRYTCTAKSHNFKDENIPPAGTFLLLQHLITEMKEGDEDQILSEFILVPAKKQSERDSEAGK